MAELFGGVDVSRETMAELKVFSDLVLKWTPRINLIGARSESEIWDRHILDSVQVYRLAPEGYGRWVDIGSGGGFPGIVVAILGKSRMPDAQFVLIESDQRKAVFLRTAARELGLNVTVIADRIESVQPSHADVVSARALGTLPVLLPLVLRHLKATGIALLHKGRQVDAEIEQARLSWSFDLEQVSSLTDPEGRLLVLKRISSIA